jgi:predicted membrane protein
MLTPAQSAAPSTIFGHLTRAGQFGAAAHRAEAEFSTSQARPHQVCPQACWPPEHWTTDCSSWSEGAKKKMPLLNLVVVLIIVGVALYLVNRYIPMASSIKTILNAVVVIAVCVWLLQAVGLWGRVTSFRLHG